jgi:hypothetical protein
MKKRTKTTIIIATSYFLALLGMFVYALYLVNMQGATFAAARVEIAERAAKEAAYASVISTTEQSQADRAELESYFITERETVRFIAAIETAATQIGVTFETTELSVTDAKTTDTETTPATLTVGTKFTGSERAVTQFLTLLETLPYHATIPSLSMTNQTENGNWVGQAQVILTLKP